ncbi:PREDICTED: vanin-like protein 2 isoform X1 [Papilio polytes]|uniref:vanin-like protein 2 isoform X1 n=1 Tax=Papilio polytes TaxID=76194 RepID=UPI000676ABF2|nr:PREDICTED: vanin-like protein 2 isoform X1 [Papilio polytes]
MRLFVSTLFLCLVFYSEQKSTPQDDSYVAAVVEYEVNTNVSTNLQNYVNLIKEAAEQNADIIVFPEMTLTRGQRRILVPVHGILKTTPIPALNPELYDEILVSISAAAREHLIYVVINVQEVMDCSNAPGEYCPEQKEYLFNTNVVFDRNGAVIDRYRKINLFGEFTRTPALKPELGIFSTDFGVTFGHYICFDLMFQVPAVQVVQKHNLTDVIFSTMWFSEMPYLTAVEIQEAYTYAMNVNFLASGANNVRVGSAGSGIYSGKAGALISVMPGVPTTRLLVAKVPKVPGQVKEDYPGPISDDPKALDSLRLISDPSLPSHSSRELVSGSQEFTLTTNEVSCKFSVNLQLKDGGQVVHYRALAKDGINTYSRKDLGVATCAIVACKNDSIKSCPYRFEKTEDVVLEDLVIEMTSHVHHYNTSLQCDDVIYFPISFTNNKFPVRPKNVTFLESSKITSNEVLACENNLNIDLNGHKEHIIHKINKPQSNLVAFGVWGRIYNRDFDHNKRPTEDDLKNYLEIEDWIYKKQKKENVI